MASPSPKTIDLAGLLQPGGGDPMVDEPPARPPLLRPFHDPRLDPRFDVRFEGSTIMVAFVDAGGTDYLVTVTRTDPRTFCMPLGKVLPTQVAGDAAHEPVRVQVSWLAPTQRPSLGAGRLCGSAVMAWGISFRSTHPLRRLKPVASIHQFTN